MSKSALLGSSLFTLGQTFFTSHAGDQDVMAKHCSRADKTSLKADDRFSKVSFSKH